MADLPFDDLLPIESSTPARIVIDESRFEHDLKISESYQAFASEILRLALLAVAGLSAVWLKLYIPDAGVHGHPARLPVYLEWSFACFVLSTGTALMDKFVAAKSLEHHLKLMRRRGLQEQGFACTPADLEETEKLKKKRDAQYRNSVLLLTTAIASLVLGVVVFGFAMRTLMQ